MKVTSEHLEWLIAKVALGDQAAFKELYDACASRFNGIAYRVVRDLDIANEITQEAFIQIWKNSADFNPATSQPMTWMSAIVRYRAYDRKRYESSRLEGRWTEAEKDDEGAVFQPASEQESVPLICRIDDKLNTCFSALHGRERQAILMAYYYGHSRSEMAEYFDCPINSIKSIIRRAITRLQTCLDN
ncbi:sigma-70 family RNA polymerase sigma factor [Algicola sagamiensis]|uniref:sigma-70 family RNA polymerase sigma factor n=1 Tax=Algicola sagamiensis TaxID=163869 RepID=UPI00037D7543|nr:sigma-70 family RNA polymerase sigma factor [Algicola sagamiensis]